MRGWLREIRRGKALSQREIAASAHITVQYYSYIETGERRPSPQVAKRIAAALGFEETWWRLLDDEEGEKMADTG